MTTHTFSAVTRSIAAPFAGVGALFVLTTYAEAVPILNVTLTSPAVIANCSLDRRGDHAVTYPSPIGSHCVSLAYRPLLADWNSTFVVGNFDGIPPTSQTFQTAFTNWNIAQGANFGGMWALKNGGNLDVTFTVRDFAVAEPALGGINPFSVDIGMNPGYTGPTLSQLVWTQALYMSYSPQPPFNVDLNPPAHTLDTYSFSHGNPSDSAFLNPCRQLAGPVLGPNNTTPVNFGPSPRGVAYCDPIYPFHAPLRFFDAPRAFWPDESFRAIALLSTVTFVTDATGAIIERDLTVYNGVNWSFDLAVPEPPTLWLIFVVAFPWILMAVGRRCVN
jgi:hypothetical protein